MHTINSKLYVDFGSGYLGTNLDLDVKQVNLGPINPTLGKVGSGLQDLSLDLDPIKMSSNLFLCGLILNPAHIVGLNANPCQY